MENTMYKDLVKLQSELTTIQKNKTGYITKSAKFQYADLTAIWEHIRKPMTRNNFALVQLIDSVEDKTYIITQLIHSSGDMIESKTFVPGRAVQPKESGILYTYYKRYALSAILGLTTDEDADQFIPQQKEMVEEAKPSKKEPIVTDPGLISVDEANILKQCFELLSSPRVKQKMFDAYGISKIEDLKKELYHDTFQAVNVHIEAKKDNR